MEIRPGAFAGERWTPISSVACYVPRGKGAFPSVMMMTTLVQMIWRRSIWSQVLVLGTSVRVLRGWDVGTKKKGKSKAGYETSIEEMCRVYVANHKKDVTFQ